MGAIVVDGMHAQLFAGIKVNAPGANPAGKSWGMLDWVMRLHDSVAQPT